MAEYKNKAGEVARLSALSRQDSFRIYEADGEIAAECLVEQRNGQHWVKGLWVKPAYRGYRLASELLRAVGLAYTETPLYLWVQGFYGQPKTDEELTDMYAQFGYKPTSMPGILCRDYSFLKE